MKKFILSFLAFPLLVSAQVPCLVNSNSLTFSSSYIQMPSSSALDITDSVTVEAWINPTSFGATSSDNSIVCKHGSTAGKGGYTLRCGDGGILSFAIAGVDTPGTLASWVEVLSSNAVIPLNNWTHVAGSYDGATLKLFVNGVQIKTKAFVGTINALPSYDMRVGRFADTLGGQTRYFSGKIDEVRVWHRAVPASQIMSNYNHHIVALNANQLVGYWRFNEGSGLTVNDSSANAIQGTCNSTVWSTVVPFNEIPTAPVMTWNGIILTSSASSNNHWYLNGVAISGATAQIYTPTQPGVYYVAVFNTFGCSAISNSQTLTNTGINQISEQGFSISPVPAQDFVTINLNSSAPSTVQIIDINGKVILRETENSESFKMNISKLSPGIYNCLITQNQNQFRKTFIRN